MGLVKETWKTCPATGEDCVFRICGAGCHAAQIAAPIAVNAERQINDEVSQRLKRAGAAVGVDSEKAESAVRKAVLVKLLQLRF